jgi:acyl-CoA thioesterase FadM
LQVRLTILRLTRRSLTISYEFRRGDLVLALGEMKTAYCIIPAGAKLESAEMPDEYFDRLTIPSDAQTGSD